VIDAAAGGLMVQVVADEIVVVVVVAHAPVAAIGSVNVLDGMNTAIVVNHDDLQFGCARL